jgi:hypothetical protein
LTATLPQDVQQVFHQFVTTECTTLDRRGQPITWPLIPYYQPGAPTIDVTTGLGYPKKANDARANPKVALLFSDPTGSRIDDAPAVLVQGIAHIDDADLDANRERYKREQAVKLPATVKRQPPDFVQRSRYGLWYYARIYICVRPERIYVWPAGDTTREPELLDAHLDEVRSGHSEEPEAEPPPVEGTGATWTEDLDALGSRTYPTAVLAFVSPDGFPFSVRVPITPDRGAGLVRIGGANVGAPLSPGLACLTAHVHDADFGFQRNFQVRGDLVEDGDGWALVPHKFVGGFNIPAGQVEFMRENLEKMRRYYRVAKVELAKREARG